MRPAWLFVAIAGLMTTSQVNAAEQIGMAVDAKTRVVRTGTNGRQVVAASTPVFLDDNLRANATGLAQIKLADDTKIVVGPNSNVKLDDFVFSSSSSAKTVTVSVSKGAFRWISGHSGSQAYTIKTPAGSIGVRGTALDVTILGKKTSVLLLRGEVTVCPGNAPCKQVRKRCDCVTFGRNGLEENVNLLKNSDIKRYEKRFPMLTGQERLQPQFRRETAGCKGVTSIDIGGAMRILFTPPPTPEPEKAHHHHHEHHGHHHEGDGGRRDGRSHDHDGGHSNHGEQGHDGGRGHGGHDGGHGHGGHDSGYGHGGHEGDHGHGGHEGGHGHGGGHGGGRGDDHR